MTQSCLSTTEICAVKRSGNCLLQAVPSVSTSGQLGAQKSPQGLERLISHHELDNFPEGHDFTANNLVCTSDAYVILQPGDVN